MRFWISSLTSLSDDGTDVAPFRAHHKRGRPIFRDVLLATTRDSQPLEVELRTQLYGSTLAIG